MENMASTMIGFICRDNKEKLSKQKENKLRTARFLQQKHKLFKKSNFSPEANQQYNCRK